MIGGSERVFVSRFAVCLEPRLSRDRLPRIPTLRLAFSEKFWRKQVLLRHSVDVHDYRFEVAPWVGCSG